MARRGARLAQTGVASPAAADGAITAIAATQGLVLVTANVRAFERFGSFSVRDWRS